MDNKENEFKFTYSAPTAEERREIDAIRRQYAQKSKDGDKLARLRFLDARVKRLPMAIALSVGIVGCLIFGTGMTLFLEWAQPVWGVIVAVVGALVALLAYPTHRSLGKRLKASYGDEILRLCEELLADDLQTTGEREAAGRNS